MNDELNYMNYNTKYFIFTINFFLIIHVFVTCMVNLNMILKSGLYWGYF